VTFLGPSVCGKTTMLRTLAGFHAPDVGTIHVADQLMSSPQAIVRPEMRRMGMVFQNYAVKLMGQEGRGCGEQRP
jgi:iron(III) transport system ATP-binding protein